MLITKHQNGFSQEEKNIFYSLLYISGGFRGRDGTGVFVVDHNGNVEMAKNKEPVDSYLQSKECSDLFTTAYQRGWAMVGHNRAATRGSVEDVNSHPFVVDDKIVLVHNGSFNGSHKHLKDTDVDSEAIAHAIAETDDIEEALRKINAAYTLMWYNVDEKKMSLVRNLQRPLFHLETNDSYIFSSDKAFLDFVVSKYSLKPLQEPYSIKEYNLLEYTLQADKSTEFTFKEIDVSYYKHQPTKSYTDTQSSFTSYMPVNIKKIIEALAPTVKAFTNKQWAKEREKYDIGSTVRVVIDDLVEADDKPRTHSFLLLGKTMDENEMPVVIPASNLSCSEVIDTRMGVFDMKIDTCSWRREDSVFKVDQSKPIADWPGIALLHGVEVTPVIMLQ